MECKSGVTRPLIIMVRHGQRADSHPDPKVHYQISYDPCLTTVGLQQAFLTGQFIKSRFALLSRNVTLFSSPLLRTVQTSTQVLRAIGPIVPPKIRVHNYLVEELYKMHFPVDPLPSCLIRTKPYDYIKHEVLGDADMEFVDNTPLKYPESWKQATQRCHKGFEFFAKKYEKEPNAAVVLVGHGRLIDEFNQYFGRVETCNDEYCAVSAAEFVDGKWRLIMCDYCKHLGTLERKQ